MTHPTKWTQDKLLTFGNDGKMQLKSDNQSSLKFLRLKLHSLSHSVWKSSKMSHLSFSIMALSTNFCPNKIDLSGNTVWPQASGVQKLVKIDNVYILNGQMTKRRQIDAKKDAKKSPKSRQKVATKSLKSC